MKISLTPTIFVIGRQNARLYSQHHLCHITNFLLYFFVCVFGSKLFLLIFVYCERIFRSGSPNTRIHRLYIRRQIQTACHSVSPMHENRSRSPVIGNENCVLNIKYMSVRCETHETPNNFNQMQFRLQRTQPLNIPRDSSNFHKYANILTGQSEKKMQKVHEKNQTIDL